MNLVFQVTQRQRLIIVSSALKQMQAFAQHRPRDAEAGGVLLGRHLLDSQDIVIDEVTTPQASDRRSRAAFFRSSEHDQLARKKWIEQEQTLAYLGLWHTHPEPSPTPSSVDRLDWIQAISRDTFEGDRLFFPIVGTQHLRIWTISRRGAFRELKPESGDASTKDN